MVAIVSRPQGVNNKGYEQQMSWWLVKVGNFDPTLIFTHNIDNIYKKLVLITRIKVLSADNMLLRKCW